MATINGTPNDDVLVGTSDSDDIFGKEGNDIIYGGSDGNPDILHGDAGDDIYIIRNIDDLIVENGGGSFGTDTVYVTFSYDLRTFSSAFSIEVLSTLQHSGTDNINISGNWTNTHTMMGNYGNNILSGCYGTIYGFLGDDIYRVWASQNPDVLLIENAGEGNDVARVFGDGSYTLNAGSHVETITVEDVDSTTSTNLTGNELTQTIIGNKGANVLDGGSAGSDTLIGGDGNDSYHVARAGLTIVETVTGGAFDRIIAHMDFDLSTMTNIEDLAAAAGTAPINLLGDAFANRLFGNNGNNILNGGQGAADTMAGGLGDDTYRINQVGDIVQEGDTAGTDIIYVDFSYSLETLIHVENLSSATHSGTANLNFTGNDRENLIIGNYGANILDGGTGGNDTLYGLAGNDTYVIRSFNDHPFEATGQGNDIAYTFLSWTLQDGSEVEAISTIDNSATTVIDLTGNELAQTVVGNFGANILDGKGGNDLLAGLAGADTFRFSSTLGAGNVDTIFDFSAADDTIAIDDAVFAGMSLGGLSASAFVIGTAAADADDRFIYNSANGQLLFDADGSGSGAAVHFATLQGAPALSAADFVIF